ncbi:hypothetical protein [Synechococcus sp. UW179B]|uniref:hypothetical protein n=1 Tax=Synechococcus sp. UW179B TaxID=2575516 RepID=UPI001A7E1B82|nr:hypothetical protein [Synechococcus sp. UW179B]
MEDNLLPSFVDPKLSNSSNEAELKSIPSPRIVWPSIETPHYLVYNNLEGIVDSNSLKAFSHIERSELYSKFSSTDLDLLVRMAQRTHLNTSCYSDILYYISRITTFWHRYFQFFKPEIVLSTVLPHSFGDFIFSLVAKKLDIPFLCLINAGLSTHSFIVDLSSNKLIRSSCASLDRISRREDLEILLENTSTSRNARVPYSGKTKLRASSNYSQEIRYLLNDQHHGQLALEHNVNLARYYDSLSTNPDSLLNLNKKQKFHLYYLHFQPESSTIPSALTCADQRETIHHIRSSISPKDILLVKEHPQQFRRTGRCFASEKHLRGVLKHRSKLFYDSICSIPSTYLFPRRQHFQVIPQDMLTIWYANGTIGLQAIMQGYNVEKLPTLNPFHILSRDLHLMPYKQRIEYILDTMESFLFPLSVFDHDPVASSQKVQSNITELVYSYTNCEHVSIL